MGGVEISDIHVTGNEDPLLTTDNVRGTGLEDTSTPSTRVVLWNGTDLTGWKLYLGEAGVDPQSVWSAAAGVLRLDTKAKGYLQTESSHSSYHLHVEWRWPNEADPNSNSGVLVHVIGDDAVWPKCFECQLKAGNAGQIVGTGMDIPGAPIVSNRTRATRLANASEKPFGEWNDYDIYARGDFLEAFVNGVRQNRVEKLPVSAGRIALRMEGYPVEFRNLWLQPF
jgi:3-keto-disaccharide hydrolase